MTDTSPASSRYAPSSRDIIRAEKPTPWWRGRAARRFFRHRLALIGLGILIVLTLIAVFAPLISLHDPDKGDLRMIRQPPQADHVLGTDGAGRDVWTRVAYASRVSLWVGLASVAIATLIGLTLGGLAGFLGGHVDSAIMRFTDIILCFPTLLVILSVVSVTGPSQMNVILVIGAFSWPGMCRLVRAQFLSLRELEYIQAARAIGSSNRSIIIRHLLPNVVAPVSVAITLNLAGAILTEAGLSFLGLSVQVPTPTWGNMLLGATSISLIENNWWLWVPPGMMIALAVLAINFVGDGLRDALDPRMRLD